MHLESLQKLDCTFTHATPDLCDNRLGDTPLTYIPCDIVTLTERIDTKQSNHPKALSLPK
jgi:hypothetical protein